MRYPVSGSATGAIPAPAAGGVSGPINLLGRAITTGRVFWLRKAWFYNGKGQATAGVSLCDSTTTATGPTGANWVTNADGVRAIVQVVSGPSGGLNANTFVEFPAPGLKFVTGCMVACELTSSGVIGCGGSGYEE